MSDTTVRHPFNWMTVHPDFWPKQELHGHQTCKVCNLDMAVPGVLCTNMRGPWEHFDCAVAQYNAAHAAQALVLGPEVRGRQRDLIDTLHAAPGRSFVVSYTHEGRGQHERYGWRISST